VDFYPYNLTPDLGFRIRDLAIKQIANQIAKMYYSESLETSKLVVFQVSLICQQQRPNETFELT
jgi:hypothetical protein